MRSTKNKLPMGDLFEAANEAKIAELEAQIAGLEKQLRELRAELFDKRVTQPRRKGKKAAPAFAIGDTAIVSVRADLASVRGKAGIVTNRFWADGSKANPKEGFVIKMTLTDGSSLCVWEDLLDPK